MQDEHYKEGDGRPTILAAATDFGGRGWAVIPIPFREKRPIIPGWQNLRITAQNAHEYFNGKPQNLGVLLGEASGGLADVDLDSPEAVKIADFFLPKTGLIFGRSSKPRSHWLYICKDARYKKFNNPLMIKSDSDVDRQNACIAEIRGNNDGKGLQTVFPPSVHETGEFIEWSSEGTAQNITVAELEKAVSKLCAAAMVAKYWRQGIRQDLTLALAGTLLRHGFDRSDTKHFIKATCSAANDEQTPLRLQTIDSTAERFEKGQNCWGLPKLAELIDQKIVATFSEWLGIEASQASAQPAQFVGEPKALDWTLKPVEKLEDTCLPEVLVRWLRPASRVIGCPYDFLVLSAIVTAGSLIGARVRVKPIEHSDWFVVPNLYGGLVGLPSTKKTPALDETQQPIRALQNKAREELKSLMRDYEIDLHFFEKRQKEAYSKAKNPTEAKDLLADLESPPKPALRRFQTNDVTTSKLIHFLSENPNGLLLFRDELIGWLRSLENDYDKSARAFILEVWKGAISYELARVDGREIPLTSGTLSIIGGIQPSKLQKYVAEAYSFDNSDGFLQRLTLVYPDVVGKSGRPTASDYESKQYGYNAGNSVFEALAERDFEGKCISANGDKFFPVTFSKTAQRIIDDWKDAVEREAESIQTRDEAFAAYLYKLPKTCFSIALIFHCLENTKLKDFRDEISLETAQKALDYTRVLISHARRIFALGENQIFDLARKLIEKIQGGDLGHGFTFREIMRKKWSGFRSGEDVNEVLSLLIEYGYLVAVENTTGRKSSKFYFHDSLKNSEVIDTENQADA